jgi:hypothetical protein
MATRATKHNPVHKALTEIISVMDKHNLCIEPHPYEGFIVCLNDSGNKYHIKTIEYQAITELPPFEEWVLIQQE